MTHSACRAVLTVAVVVLAGILSVAAPAQQAKTPQKAKLVATDLLPLTCAQAWVKADKSYEKMVSIVKMLARVSLANRDLTFPDTREAGQEAGKGIAEDCKADPNGLLFAFVDKQVRRFAEAPTDPVK